MLVLMKGKINVTHLNGILLRFPYHPKFLVTHPFAGPYMTGKQNTTVSCILKEISDIFPINTKY